MDYGKFRIEKIFAGTTDLEGSVYLLAQIRREDEKSKTAIISFPSWDEDDRVIENCPNRITPERMNDLMEELQEYGASVLINNKPYSMRGFMKSLLG